MMKRLFLLTLFITAVSFTNYAKASVFSTNNLTCTIETLPSDSCLYGQWIADKDSYKRLLEQVSEGMISVDSIEGDVFLAFNSSGRNIVYYDDFEVKAQLGDYAGLRYLYQGGAEGSYTTQAKNTQICSKVESQNLKMSAWITIEGKETQVPIDEAPIGESSLMSYVCDQKSLTYFYESDTERMEWIFWRQ